MRFTHLMLQAHLIGHRGAPIGIIGDQPLGIYALGNRLNPGLERLKIFGWQGVNRQGQPTDWVNRDAQG